MESCFQYAVLEMRRLFNHSKCFNPHRRKEDMDKYLIDYLNSGKAWVVIGTGPSLQMGYPSWQELARNCVPWLKSELFDCDLSILENFMANGDWPAAFQEASRLLGDESRLIQYLNTILKPKEERGEIYDLISRWPIPVYLTTNWDDEIQKHLTKAGETYLTYGNSSDHMSYMIPDLQGAIFKLHGDLRSKSGLVMTSNEYTAIDNGEDWEHWRFKMNAVFQMNRVVVIGHSLTDPHMRHILASAKSGAGIVQPVIWIAPDADDKLRREMLEQYRIRVVSYFNQDGQHKDLLHVLRDITRFVVPRERISIQQDLARAIPSAPNADTAAAAALLVYSKISESDPIEIKRTKLIVASLESAILKLGHPNQFRISDVLKLAGWPDSYPLSNSSAIEVAEEATKQGLLVPVGDSKYAVGSKAIDIVKGHIAIYNHVRERFQRAIAQRISRLFSAISSKEASQLAIDIDRALIGCFQADGFALASSTFDIGTRGKRVLPGSIIDFLNNASAQYPNLLQRRAFFSSVVDMLTNPTQPDIQYLGSLVGGYCAFNYLGVYGDVAIHRLQHAKETVWLVDSDVQIPLLAFAAPTHLTFFSCINRVQQSHIRFFTLESLFEETFRHYLFAHNVVDHFGASSPEVLYAAQGQPPYRKSNQFLGGFIRWQAAGNSADWGQYLSIALGSRNPGRPEIRSRLESFGISVIEFDSWPGFEPNIFEERDRLTEEITKIRVPATAAEDSEFRFDSTNDPKRKAKPEAEALIVIQKERVGIFNILSNSVVPNEGWFISHTRILNALCRDGSRVTWPPESFIRFTESLSMDSVPSDSVHANCMFETILWSISQSGLDLLDQKAIDAVFGSLGDQFVISINQQRNNYSRVLEKKYGSPIDKVFEKIPKADQPMAALQLANEIAQKEQARADLIAHESGELKKRLKDADHELARLNRFRKKAAAKAAKGKRKARKQASKPKRQKTRR
jgi:hypothetical protein